MKLTNAFLTSSRWTWVLLDLILVFVAFWVSAFLSPHSKSPQFYESVLLSASLYTYFFFFTALGFGYYERDARLSLRTSFQVGIAAILSSVLLTLSTIYFFYYTHVGRLVLFFGALGSMLLLMFFRYLLVKYLRKNPIRFIWLGEPSLSSIEISEHCKKNTHLPYNEITLQGNELALLYANVDRKNHENNLEAFLNHLKSNGIQDIFLTNQGQTQTHIREVALLALREGFRISFESEFYAEIFESYPASELEKSWLLVSSAINKRSRVQILKRLFDFTMAFALCILLAPVALIVALLILLFMGQPVLFIQERCGRYCKAFPIFKFRTMTTTRIKTEKSTPSGTQINDIRVTRLGRVLRKLHLDEIPQVINILLGHMSFVGPRPGPYPLPSVLKNALALYEYRYLIRPGLTGLAQIKIGYTLDTPEETQRKLAYDLYYLQNQKFSLDLLILLRTVFLLMKKSR